MRELTIEQLWKNSGFSPNSAQEEAIRHIQGPLFITAGPGSGKTRVLLWRALNLIVFNGIKPEEIYLSTFTEKAATQLQEGLRASLGDVTNVTGHHYDISKMYVGTVHSSCQKILSDRRFSPQRQRPDAPALMDELQQYMLLYNNRIWDELKTASGIKSDHNPSINRLFTSGYASSSKHVAVENCISLFGRLSEELIAPDKALREMRRKGISPLIRMYDRYMRLLAEEGRTDFSLVQKAALDVLNNFRGAGQVFKHVIIDEYQDTNTVQERLFFALAKGQKNICVVGDDDQALYRFRGATVENFVQFPDRCQRYLNCVPKVVSLTTNYRSQDHIVDFYGEFIQHESCDWKADRRGKRTFRVPKTIQAYRQTKSTAVVASAPGDPETVAGEIADLVEKLIIAKKVKDPNQIAFLYPSLHSASVEKMINALEDRNILTYAPRAGHFFDVPEAVDVFGVFFHVFGKPEANEQFMRGDYEDYFDWVSRAYRRGKELLRRDIQFARYVSACKKEIATAARDFKILSGVADRKNWDTKKPFHPDEMLDSLVRAVGLSPKAKRGLSSRYFLRIVRKRLQEGQRPFTLQYVINRFSSLDWTPLDLFYRVTGFKHFKKMFDAAANGDEGPICNLSLITGYLDTYIDNNRPIITGEALAKEYFVRSFFNQYLFSLYRRGESEYENAEDPFPKGRVPFLTIHQSKGLEFPVVVLGSARKDNRGPQIVEKMVSPLLSGKREPLDRIADFDKMRMFYVALSRAMNLLVVAHFHSKGNHVSEPFTSLLDQEGFPRIADLDVTTVPEAEIHGHDLPKTYSYTGDYLFYKRCPRNYMIFRKYGFAPSRSQTMFFGNLIHQTIEDLHQFLIAQKAKS